MTSQQFLVFDNSTLANFKSWAQPISTFFATTGWTQTADTGQVNWSSIASVPASGAFVYEVWKPGDALTAFYVKMQYGTGSASPAGPRWRWQLGTGTDGAGNLTGFVVPSASTFFEIGNSTGVGQGSTTFECNFSGASERISLMLWRNGTGSSVAPAQMMSVERTKDTSGVNTSEGVTAVSCGPTSTPTGIQAQQTIAFGLGAAPVTASRVYIALGNGQNASSAFNNNIPVSPVFPEYGKYGNPLTTIGFVHTQEIASGGTFSTTLYGSTITYMASAVTATAPSNMNVVMRWD